MLPLAFVSPLLFYYGLFLILCGISALLFIGKKAKTALISGGTSGALAIIISHFIHQEAVWAPSAAIVLTLGLFCVFAWRSTKTLFALLALVKADEKEYQPKAVAFLIIGLMAVVSLFTLMLQLVWLS